MSVIEWQQTTQEIADIMLKHTRPFVTALSTETSDKVRLVGTGSFLDTGNKQLLLTCEHVARDQPMHFCFSGSDDVFKLPGPWTMDSHPIDAAYAQVNLSPLSAQQHRAQAIPLARFAEQHKTIEKAELLFFRGFAGENAHYGFGVHQTNGTGYCSQEKEGTGDKENFEIFWEPDQTQFTQNTPTEAQREIKFEDARGYSVLLFGIRDILKSPVRVSVLGPQTMLL